MPLIIIIIILLLIWGNISRRSASHPINAIVARPPIIVCGIHGGVGDTFTGGDSIVSGVCEPHDILHCNIAPIIPIHITMPIEPPPIAIQNPTTATPALILVNGSLIGRSQVLPGAPVGMMQNGRWRGFQNPETFNAMGKSWNAIKWIDQKMFDSMPKGDSFPDLTNGKTIQGSGAEVDYIQNGTRRWILNPATFNAMGLDWNKIQHVSDADFKAIPQGAPMPDLTPAPVVVPKPAPVAPIKSAGGLLWGTSGTPVKKPAPYFCTRGGNGPGWCVDKLNQLANQHCHMGSGCGAF